MTIPDYEGMLEKYYRSILRPGDVCVDVGAHLGRHAFPMADCVGPDGAVYAFEPLPHIRADLERRIDRDRNPRRARIFVSPIALGDFAGTAEFVSVEDFPEYSGLRERIYDVPVKTTRIRVDTQRLDSFCARIGPVRFVKIDAEGAEFMILSGATGLLDRDRPIVSFECGDNALVKYDHTAADLHDLLSCHAYRVIDILGRPIDRTEMIRSSAEQTVWDYVALPT